MKTNCELPLCLLHENEQLNDYDFVLFHLYQSNERYRNYYLGMRKLFPERLMIFDNSAYEFFVKGETLDMDAFVEAIHELRPDYYILPDVLRDKEKTLAGVQEFMTRYVIAATGQDVPTIPLPLAVAQGNSSIELVECLEMYREMGIKYVGIPFHLPFYRDSHKADDINNEFMSYYPKTNEDLEYAMGRVQWVRDHEDFLKTFEKVHFLGSHCPLEKVFYKDFYTMDTGYPVKLGVVGGELLTEAGKPNILIDDFLTTDLPGETKDRIRKNITIFKEL